MLKQRVITALIVVTVLLTAIFLLPGVWLGGLLGVIVVVAALEWARLAGLRRGRATLPYAAVFPLLMIAAINHVGLYGADGAATDILRQLFAITAVFWALALLWALSYPGSAVIWGSVPVRLVMGALVLVPAWLALSWLRELPNGRWLLIYVILLVSCNDIAAYFAGRAWGRRKLLPEVSPGKTWAGFFGGLGGGLACAALIGLFLAQLDSRRLLVWVVIGGFAVLAGVLGDFVESMIKRNEGVKDSGTLLPGHGGVLDRIDSITAAAPVFALALLATDFSL